MSWADLSALPTCPMTKGASGVSLPPRVAIAKMKARAHRTCTRPRLHPVGRLLLVVQFGPLLAIGARPAASQDAARTLPDILYSAPALCPSPQDFAQRVSEATGGDPGSPGTRYEVLVEPREAGFRGRLRVVEAGNGSGSERSVTGANCDEVVRALALMTALAIAPEAALQPRPSASVSPAIAVSVAPNASSAPTPQAPARSVSAGPRSWESAAGAGFQGVQGLAPGWLLAAAVYGELGSSYQGWLSPSARVSAILAPDQRFDAPPGRASFQWMSARVEACVLRPAIGTSGHVHVCPMIEIGTRRGTGEGVSAPRQERRGWAAAGVMARVVVVPVGPVEIWLEAGAGAALTRQTWTFRPDVTIGSTPTVGFRGGGGVGVHF